MSGHQQHIVSCLVLLTCTLVPCYKKEMKILRRSHFPFYFQILLDWLQPIKTKNNKIRPKLQWRYTLKLWSLDIFIVLLIIYSVAYWVFLFSYFTTPPCTKPAVMSRCRKCQCNYQSVVWPFQKAHSQWGVKKKCDCLLNLDTTGCNTRTPHVGPSWI